MFELTRKADYALRLMIDVAARPGASVSTADIARREDIPYQFLRKVARDLASRGLLNAGRGVKGGVSLARPAEEITALDVVKAIEPPAINRCTVDPAECERREFCAAYPVWRTVQAGVEQTLRAARLSDLARRHKVQAAAHPAAPGRTQSERRRATHHSSTKSPRESVQKARPRRAARGLDSSGTSVQEGRDLS